jgi:hypothetical protein
MYDKIVKKKMKQMTARSITKARENIFQILADVDTNNYPIIITNSGDIFFLHNFSLQNNQRSRKVKKIIFGLFTIIVIFISKDNILAAGNEDYTYVLKDGYAVISGYTGTESKIELPDVIEGHIVTKIGESAFRNNEVLEEISIPDSITAIDYNAFSYCTALKEITLPKTIAMIDSNAFYNCINLEAIHVDKTDRNGYFSIDGILYYSGLEKVMNGYGENEHINSDSWYDGGHLILYPASKVFEEYRIPNFVGKIHSNAIQNSRFLKKLIIPDSIKYVDYNCIGNIKNPIDIFLGSVNLKCLSEIAFTMYVALDFRDASLLDGSRIICKNEALYNYVLKHCSSNTIVDLAADDSTMPISEVVLTSEENITLGVNDTAYISWKQFPEESFENVIWTSSDPNSLSVNSSTGEISAFYRGNYTVTGAINNGDTICVNVTVPTLVTTIEDYRMNFYNYDNYVRLSSGDICYTDTLYEFHSSYIAIGIQENDLTESTIEVTYSCNKEYTQIKYANGSKFLVFKEAGECTISAFVTVKDNNGVTISQGQKTYTFLVKPYPKKTSTFYESSEPFCIGKTVQLSFDPENENLVKNFCHLSVHVNSNQEIECISSNPEIAKILMNTDGAWMKLEAYNVGTANITIIAKENEHYQEIRMNFTVQVVSNNTNEYKPLTANFTGKSLYTKTYGNLPFTLDTKVSSRQKLQYSSSNNKVVIVDKLKGTVEIKGVGKAVITVTALANDQYAKRSKKITVQISKASISKVKINPIANQPYSGKAIEPGLNISYNGIKLNSGNDYTLSYQNNTRIGTSTIVIIGINRFSGSRQVTFKIVTIGNPTLLKQNTNKSTASNINLTWQKVAGADGYKIFRSTKKSSAYVKIKTVTKGNLSSFTNKRLKSGTVYYYKICAYRKINGSIKNSTYSNILIAITKPGKAALTVKGSRKKSILNWKPVSGASGYEIYRSIKKGSAYRKIKTITNGKANKYADNSLDANKTYYYKIRVYKKVGHKTAYGIYSTVRMVKM